eukprot:6185198-Pyramimonas_sp.AAC.1
MVNKSMFAKDWMRCICKDSNRKAFSRVQGDTEICLDTRDDAWGCHMTVINTDGRQLNDGRESDERLMKEGQNTLQYVLALFRSVWERFRGSLRARNPDTLADTTTLADATLAICDATGGGDQGGGDGEVREFCQRLPVLLRVRDRRSRLRLCCLLLSIAILFLFIGCLLAVWRRRAQGSCPPPLGTTVIAMDVLAVYWLFIACSRFMSASPWYLDETAFKAFLHESTIMPYLVQNTRVKELADIYQTAFFQVGAPHGR